MRYTLLLAQYKDDLMELQNILQDNKEPVTKNEDTAPIYCNMPPVTGAIYWINSLRQPKPRNPRSLECIKGDLKGGRKRVLDTVLTNSI